MAYFVAKCACSQLLCNWCASATSCCSAHRQTEQSTAEAAGGRSRSLRSRTLPRSLLQTVRFSAEWIGSESNAVKHEVFFGYHYSRGPVWYRCGPAVIGIQHIRPFQLLFRGKARSATAPVTNATSRSILLIPTSNRVRVTSPAPSCLLESRQQTGPRYLQQ